MGAVPGGVDGDARGLYRQSTGIATRVDFGGNVQPLLPDGEKDPEAMDAMCTETAERLRAARGERAAIVSAISQFLDFGEVGEYSPAELWDYFATSYPTVPERAEFDDAEQDRITRIFATVTHARWGGGKPLPPDWPWFEHDQ